MMVGAKNIHSSSGCAVIRRTLPSSFIFGDLFLKVHVTSEKTRTPIKPTAKLTDHREVRRDISSLPNSALALENTFNNSFPLLYTGS